MIAFLVILLLLGLVAVVVPLIWTYVGDVPSGRNGMAEFTKRRNATLRFWLPGGAAVTFIAIILLMSFTSVPAGHNGVVLSWGGKVENKIFHEGANWRVPLKESVIKVDTRVQAHAFENLGAASSEMQDVFIWGNVNWHFDPAYVNWIYQNIGASSDFVNKILDQSLQDFVKEVTNKFQVTTILNSRAEIRSQVVDFLTKNLSRYHIVVNDVYLSNITFSVKYTQSIEDKQVAEMQVATQKNVLEQKKIQAEQVKIDAEGQAQAAIAKAEGDKKAAILRAEGEAQSTLIKAQKQAEANDTLNKSITGDILTWTLYNTLGPDIKVMILPNGQQFILDPNALMPTAK